MQQLWKRDHRAAGCWAKKGKEKDKGADNLLFGSTLCGEVQEENDGKYPEEWLGDSGESSHITHKKKYITDVKKCEINVTVENCQNMKCELKGFVNMKIQDGKMMKLTEVL